MAELEKEVAEQLAQKEKELREGQKQLETKASCELERCGGLAQMAGPGCMGALVRGAAATCLGRCACWCASSGRAGSGGSFRQEGRVALPCIRIPWRNPAAAGV